jgi:hypothetical protein
MVKNMTHLSPTIPNLFLSQHPFSNINSDAVHCQDLRHLLQHRVGHHLHMCFKVSPRPPPPPLHLSWHRIGLLDFVPPVTFSHITAPYGVSRSCSPSNPPPPPSHHGTCVDFLFCFLTLSFHGGWIDLGDDLDDFFLLWMGWVG